MAGTLITVEGKLRNNDGKLSVRVSKAGVFNPQDGDLSHHEAAAAEAVAEPAPTPTEAVAEPVVEQEVPLAETNGHEETALPEEVVLGSNGRNGSNGSSENSNGNAVNGDETRKGVLLNLTDTGNASDDAYLLKSAMELLLEYKGTDHVYLDITSNSNRVRLEMPMITTKFCPALEVKLDALLGPGRTRLI